MELWVSVQHLKVPASQSLSTSTLIRKMPYYSYFKIHVNIILSCNSVSSKWSPTIRIPHKTLYTSLLSLIRALWPAELFVLELIIRKYIYRVSQEECASLQESVPYVKLYRYNPKHLYPKLNGYGDNGQRSLKFWQLLLTYWLPNTYWNWQE